MSPSSERKRLVIVTPGQPYSAKEEAKDQNLIPQNLDKTNLNERSSEDKSE